MTPTENESLRHAALNVLAIRHPAALPLAAIKRRILTERLVDFDPADSQVHAALVFLLDLKLTRFVADELGSTQYWTATSDGVKAHERGTLTTDTHG